MLQTIYKRFQTSLLLKSVIGSALIVASSLVQAQSLPAELESAWKATRLPMSALSVVVYEIGSRQQPLLEVNPVEPRNPASVMKMVTTYTALSALGPDWKWRSEMMLAPGSQISEDGHLNKPLYIKAGGDPSLQVEDLAAMLVQLRMQGIKSIPSVVVDRSIFGNVTIDPGAFDGAASSPYNASPDAWMVGMGALRVAATPDFANRAWNVQVEPPIQNVSISGDLNWRDGPCNGTKAVPMSVRPVAGGAAVRIGGTVPSGCGQVGIYRILMNQPDQANGILRQQWEQLGGEITGGVTEGRVPAKAEIVATRQSSPLSEVVAIINKSSNNLMARQLLISLGVDKTRSSGATPEKGAQVLKATLAQQGIDVNDLILENGSGLSRIERISAKTLAQLLIKAWASDVKEAFVNSLAIAGVDGTVRNRMKGSTAAGNAHLKTGTLRNVRALAGYVRASSGKMYVMVSFINHGDAVRANPFNNSLVEWLANQ